MTISRSPLLKTTICIGFASLLAGCLSSGGSDSGRSVVDRSVTDISTVASPALIAAVNGSPSVSDVQAWDSAVSPIATTLFDDKPVSPWANTPTSGQRNYIGGVALVPNGNDANRVFGVMTATADFTTNAIAGTGRDFVHIGNGTAQPGTLALDAQFFPGNDLTQELGISGSLTGTLSGPDLAGDVDIDFAGDFADSGSVIYGGGEGDISGTDLTAAVVLSQN
jgi:hypothetical protein